MPKFKVTVMSIDGGDGSAYCGFFASPAQAEEYADKHGKAYGEEINPENIYETTLEFDENGVLMNPMEWED
jgi:hypothetical protein